jgi:hypothetical protein
LVVRLAVAIVAALALACGQATGVAAEQRADPKVVIVVGPVGELTDRFRMAGAAAAREARRWTRDVVEVVSPNATWPRAKQALQGASIVVYLGHGNGWPSRYRPSLYPPTQNGLGLNPMAGGDDGAHQYFGEAFLARHVRLAPDAVVLLHHLCYASGNSEPGMPEGTLDQARQRVDNFAAGWLRAGARAVVAEAHLGPTHYVRALLSTRQTIGAIWNRAPTFKGHVMAFPSERTKRAVVQLDPDRAGGGGYHRSIAGRLDLPATAVRGGAVGAGDRPPAAPEPVVPDLAATLAAAGVRFAAPELQGRAAPDAVTILRLPVGLPTGTTLPGGFAVGYRWESVSVDATGRTPSRPSTAAMGTSDPQLPSDKGAPSLALARTVPLTGGLAAEVRLPSQPGTYQLVTTIHDGERVALGSGGASVVPAIVVQVTAPAAGATLAGEPAGAVPSGSAGVPIEEAGGR